MHWLNKTTGLILFLVICLQNISYGQKNIYVSNDLDGMSWNSFINYLEEEQQYRIFYVDTIVEDFQVKIDKDSTLLNEVLRNNFAPQIHVTMDVDNNIFFSKKQLVTSLPKDFFDVVVQRNESAKQVHKDEGFLRAEDEYIARQVVIGEGNNGHSGKVSVNGYLTNEESGEPVIGGTLFIEELETGTVTNPQGFYNLQIPAGIYTLEIQSIGRKTEKIEIDVRSSGRLDIQLEQELVALEEVVVTAEKFHNVKSTQMGFEKLSAKTVKEIPLVLGERDIVKIALMLPGIQSVGEGTSGFNVRGSPADQNMFYINNVPVYNTSHLFGFFSAFNSDAINEFSLYKSNIPAEYGGRLASIFNVTTKKGNNKNFSARGGISPITGHVLVEGPIKKDKASVLVGLRSSYSNWLLGLVEDPDIRNSSAWFGDFIANINVDISDKSKMQLFAYSSRDDVQLASEIDNNYGTTGASATWNRIVRNKHTFSISGIYSKYDYTETNYSVPINSYKHSYGLEHYEAKSSITLRPMNNLTIHGGLNSVLYKVDLGSHEPFGEESNVIGVKLTEEQGLETGLFLDNTWEISPKFAVNAGLRYNYYQFLGPQDVILYENGVEKRTSSIADTVSYEGNKTIKSYNRPDLRLSGKYELFDNLSVKLSYNETYQNIFMLSNTIAISPTDKWKLSDYHIKPMRGKQFAGGIYSNFARNKIETSAEVYLKQVSNQVDYKDGADVLISKYPETQVLQGDLESYGLELMLRKPFGRFNGWLNYTYSSAKMHIDGDIPGNAINFGNPYPANHDKPHAVNLVANYKFSRRLSISWNTVYSTGRPITFPAAVYYINNDEILHYSKRNEYRLPDYFRMDISVNLEGNLLSKKFAHGSWMFSVYNLTGRKNAYSVFFKNEEGRINGYKLSIFGQPIITITYNFKLGNYAS